MRILQLTATAGADGRVHLDFPAEPGVELEVALVVQAKPPTNDDARKPTSGELGWPLGYFEETYGSIQDEAFKRYPQGEAQIREALE